MTSSLDKGVSTLEDDQYKDLREFYMRDEVFNPLWGTNVYIRIRISKWIAGRNLKN